MRNMHALRLAFGGVIMVMFALGFIPQVTPAQAQALTDPYTITLTADGATTIPYNGTTGAFYATFDHAVPLPGNGSRVDLFVDNGTSYQGNINSRTSTADLYYFGGVAGLATGQHTLQARYFLSTTSAWIVSNTLTITVGKGHVTYMTCLIHDLTYNYAPGSNITIDLSLGSGGQQPVDWQTGTFTLAFKGPSTVTYASLKPNAAEQISAKLPTKPGQYQLNCSFNGSTLFLGNSGDQLGILVSNAHQTGKIRLYTNPTTVQANEIVTWYVVIPAAPGLPTPTGYFDIMIGRATSRQIALTGRGDAQVQIAAPSPGLMDSQIKILYFGDGVYASETATFPLTNPSIPAAGAGTTQPTPTAPPTPKATPTATTKPSTPTPTPTADATGATSHSTPSAAVNHLASNEHAAGNGATPVVASMFGLLALAGCGIGGTLWRRRRIAGTAPVRTDHIWQQEPTADGPSDLPAQHTDWGD